MNDTFLTAKWSSSADRTEKNAFVVKSARRRWAITSAGTARIRWKCSGPTSCRRRRNADPRRQRQEALGREQMRLAKNIERLITAYQEGLLSLPQLRERMPELNKKSKAVEAELQSLETGAMGRCAIPPACGESERVPKEAAGTCEDVGCS